MCYVCVLYYRRRFYFIIITHSLLYVYFLGTRYCTTCVQGNKECCVEGCMDNRHSHERDCLYCLYHRDPKTRCRNCRTRGLVEGSSALCSTCIGAWSCGHCDKCFSSAQGLRYHVDNNVCIPATAATCFEQERNRNLADGSERLAEAEEAWH